jgi:hypothetical protein
MSKILTPIVRAIICMWFFTIQALLLSLLKSMYENKQVVGKSQLWVCSRLQDFFFQNYFKDFDYI